MCAWSLSGTSAIAFDVGAASIRACQVKRRRGGFAVHDALNIELRPDPSTDESHKLELNVDRLTRLATQGRFAGRRATLVLSPPEVTFHAVRLPAKILSYAPAKIEEALAWEIARETRTEANDMEVRYWPLPPRHREGLNVMAVALPTSAARRWVGEFAERGFLLQRINVTPRALAQAAMRQYHPEASDVWAVVDVGWRRAVITVLVGEVPVYIRTLATGAHHCTRRIAEAFDMPYDQAEQLKRGSELAAAVAAPNGPGAMAVENAEDVSTAVYKALREPSEHLVRDTRLCLTYVLESYPECSVGAVFLAGGGANLSGLCEHMQRELDINTTPIAVEAGVCGRTIGTEAVAALGGAIQDLEAR